MQDQELKPIIEAALFASSQPLGLAQLAELFAEQEPIAEDRIALLLTELVNDYAERGVELVEVASGWRFQVRQSVHGHVARMWTERQTRYSRALLETLALIAYRQPITRAEIEQIRGVVVSTNIIRTLEEREWVRVVGHRDVPGRPALYGTTRQFLDYFNLKRLDELPPLGEIRDLEDLEPKLALPEPSGIALVDADAGDESPEPAVLADAFADETAADATTVEVPAAADIDGDSDGTAGDAAVPETTAATDATDGNEAMAETPTADATAPDPVAIDEPITRDSTDPAAADSTAEPSSTDPVSAESPTGSPSTDTDAAEAATEPHHD